VSALPTRIPFPAAVSPASADLQRPPATAGSFWTLRELAGRLVELSGWQRTAHLTAACGLVLDAQLGGDRAAWITLQSSSFFPPDVAEGGVDLEALPVVRVPDPRLAGRAADHLVRSGGFGLVVIDLSSASDGAYARLPVPLLTRLLGLARTHDVAVLLLTKKPSESSSLNSLVSLRAEAQWARSPMGEGRYEVRVHAIKDKRSGPGWSRLEVCRGPAGLR
jgi:recombination protein RecA